MIHLALESSCSTSKQLLSSEQIGVCAGLGYDCMLRSK